MDRFSRLRNRDADAQHPNIAAVLSFILATICLFLPRGGWTATLVLSGISIALGCLGLREAKTTKKGKRIAIAGLILGVFCVFMSFVLAALVVAARSQQAAAAA